MSQGRSYIKIVLICSAYLVLGISIALGSVRYILAMPGATSEAQFLYIERGDGLSRIAAKMHKTGLVQHAWHVTLAAKFLRIDRFLQAGEYRVEARTPLEETLKKIALGKTHLRKISIPEGFSSAEVEVELKNTFGVDMSGYERPEEGSVLPETYFFSRGEKASMLLERMRINRDSQLAKAWANRQIDLPLATPEEAIILASIVEKETAVPSERPIVAAVFINRLRKGMRLQSDPTVIYGITQGIPLGRPIKKSELKKTTPYNTYRINGLPVGPIANPGIESITAVLNPADVPYLYFVANGEGGHSFSKTLKEHNRNVIQWRALKQKQAVIKNAQ